MRIECTICGSNKHLAARCPHKPKGQTLKAAVDEAERRVPAFIKAAEFLAQYNTDKPAAFIEWLFEKGDSPIIECLPPHITKVGLQCIVDCPRCMAKKLALERLRGELK